MRDGATVHLPRGRRPTMVGLNDDLVMIGINIHPKWATVAVVDLSGRFLSRSPTAGYLRSCQDDRGDRGECLEDEGAPRTTFL